MAKKQSKQTEEKPIEFERMPGANAIEQPEGLDLNFGLGEEEVEEQQTQEVSEEAVVEEEITQETEEISAESEESTETEEPQEETVAEQSQEAEPVEAEEEIKAAEPPEQSKKPMVPKTRLDEVLQKNKAMQKELEEMKAKEEAPKEAPTYNFDAEEVKLQNLILDGQSEAAAKKRAEIRAAEREQITFEVEQKIRQEVQVSNQQNAIMDASKQIEQEYPMFDQNSEHFNAELTDEVVDLTEAFSSKGYDGADAMRKAVKYVISANNLAQPTAETAPQPTPTPKTEPTVDEVAKKRSEVAKKLKTADQQPPNLPGESSSAHGEQPLDISNMSEEEFDALPPATIARLRGDVV